MIRVHSFLASIVAMVLVLILVGGCEEDDPLEPNVSLGGRVANNSGVAGSIIVEVDSYLRCVADAAGRDEMKTHRDFYVDSLYAWVDKDGNGKYDAGEPFGFYAMTSDSRRAQSFQIRDVDITNLNFSIP